MEAIKTEHKLETSFTVIFPSRTGLNASPHTAPGNEIPIGDVVKGLRQFAVAESKRHNPIKIESYYENTLQSVPDQYAIVAHNAHDHGINHKRSGSDRENSQQLIVLKSSFRPAIFTTFREEDIVASTYHTHRDVEQALNHLGPQYKYSITLIRHPERRLTLSDAQSEITGTISYENVVAQTGISNRWDADVLEFRLCGGNAQSLKNIIYMGIHQALMPLIQVYGGRVLNERHISAEAKKHLPELARI